MNYPHLTNNANPLPWTIARGLELLHTKEIVGRKHNQTILDWGITLGIGKIYTNDEIPWCGLYVGIVCHRAKKDITPVGNILWARNWAKFGVGVDEAGLGDVLVFKRGSGGHVGFYLGENNTHYYVLGGNQSNEVNDGKIRKDRILAKRRPIYNNQPKSVKPYYLNGYAPITENEA